MGTRLDSLMLEAARTAGLAFSGTASAGDLDALVDEELIDTGAVEGFLAHSYLWRPNAAANDAVRGVQDDGYSPSAGSVRPSRAWNTAPAADEPYHIYPMIPPVQVPGQSVSWRDAVNRGLREMYYVDEIVLGAGDGKRTNRFSVRHSEVSLLAAVVVMGGTAATVTPPSGFTSVLEVNNGTDLKLQIFSGRARIDDAFAFDFTLDSSRIASGAILAYVDTNVATPSNVTASATFGPATTGTAPAATTTVADTTVLRFWAGEGVVTFYPDSTLNERMDVVREKPDAQVGLAVADLAQLAAGGSGAASAALGASVRGIAATLALQPLNSTKRVAFVNATAGENGSGAATLRLPRPSTVPNDDWEPNEQSIRKVVLRQYINGIPYDTHMGRRGRTWRFAEGSKEVVLSTSPTEEQSVVIEVNRPFPALTNASDETEAPAYIAERAAKWQAYEMLNGQPLTRGEFAVEKASAEADWREAYEGIAPKPVVVGI